MSIILERAGELAGLGAALAWSISSLLFSRVDAPASAINLFKNTVSATLLTLTALGTALAGASSAGAGTVVEWSWLATSAVIGIVVGDTLWFRSLQILGPRRALVMMTLGPPTAALLGWIGLGEPVDVRLVVGMVVTLGGVLLVILESGVVDEALTGRGGTVGVGVLFGAGATLCQALGGLTSKLGMAGSLGALEASTIRLVVAAAVGGVVAVSTGTLRAAGPALLDRRNLLRLLPASAVGSYLGIWLCLIAYQRAQLGVATTMISTTPVFAVPLVVIFLRQRVSARAIAGATLAVSGVAVLALRG